MPPLPSPTSFRRLRAAGIVLSFVLASIGIPVEAQTSQADAAAQRHFLSAQAYFERGEYDAAAREFRAAHALSGRPGLLFNIHLAEERLGHFAEAAAMLERFLAEQSEIEDRELLEARLRSLRERAAEAAQTTERTDAAPEVPAPPVAVDARRGRSRMPTGSIVAFAVGGAGVAAFAVAGGLALAEDRDLADRCGVDAGRRCTDGELAVLERRSRTADVSLALGLGAAATGLVLFFVLDDEQPPPVSAFVSTTGAAVSFQRRF